MDDKLNKERILALPPSEREKVLARLEEIAKHKQENPLYYYNHPKLSKYPQHVYQLEFHKMGKDYRDRLFSGGNQSGKTTAGVADDLIQALDADLLPPHLLPFKKFKPPFYWRIFTPDLQSTMEIVQHKIRELVPPQALLGGSWDKAYNKQQRVLFFENGSWCYFNSYDQDLDKLGGVTLMRNHYDEEPPRSVWEESQPRLVRYNGDEIFTMTPLKGLTWMYHEIWRKAGVNESSTKRVFTNSDDSVGVVIVDMDDNPSLTDEAKTATLKQYSPAVRKARKEGRFIHFSGLIYEEFKREVHVLPFEFEPESVIHSNVNVVVGIDPGFRHACAVLWGAMTPDGELVIFDELYVEKWVIEDICKKIKEINAYYEVDPIFYVIDPHARDRSKQTGRSDRMEFTENGIPTVLGQNAVETGIQKVAQQLRENKLFIAPRCRNLISEFEQYRWKEPPRSEEDARAVPIKQRDHALDALRYIVMSRPYLPEEEKVDERTFHQKLMDYDRDREVNTGRMSEFGGTFY